MVADYAGFILPCLAVPSYPAPPEVSPAAQGSPLTPDQPVDALRAP